MAAIRPAKIPPAAPARARRALRSPELFAYVFDISFLHIECRYPFKKEVFQLSGIKGRHYSIHESQELNEESLKSFKGQETDMNSAIREPRKTIGWLARESGVSVETIRFYEREYLLPRAVRAESSNYRIFDDGAVARLRFIRRAQELGFTLTEVQELLGFENTEDTQCEEVREKAEQKVQDIHSRISDLQNMETLLTNLIEQCRAAGQANNCPIIEALSENGITTGNTS